MRSPCNRALHAPYLADATAEISAREGRAMPYVIDDGGRKAAGYQGRAGDCVCRAISIVTGKGYQEVYAALNALSVNERISKRKRKRSSARNGVYKATLHKYILSLGYQWVPTMFLGQGCKVHLRADELPPGRLIVKVSRHLTAVIDGVIHDTHDPSRGGTRCVYGYYKLHDQAAPLGGGEDGDHE